MIGMIKDGGLSMPDFDIIERLLDPQAQSWKTISFSLLDSVGGPLNVIIIHSKYFSDSD